MLAPIMQYPPPKPLYAVARAFRIFGILLMIPAAMLLVGALLEGAGRTFESVALPVSLLALSFIPGWIGKGLLKGIPYFWQAAIFLTMAAAITLPVIGFAACILAIHSFSLSSVGDLSTTLICGGLLAFFTATFT
jgi:hypothetical protein